MRIQLLTCVVVSLAAVTASATEVETKFLIPGESIFKADFEDGKNPAKPNWQLRKSAWEVKDGILRGVNAGGNGPFIRLHSKEKGGVLPEHYILKFSFKVAEHPDAKKRKNKYHPTLSQGHRFSFGHYAAKYQWRPDIGMNLHIGHGEALKDSKFHIKKDEWYHVTAEIRGNEILVWFKDGPAYYMQHDHFRHKPSGWEFFTHIDEIGCLDNLQLWAVGKGCRDDWEQIRSKITSEKRSFLISENPTFTIEKAERTSTK